MEKENSMKVAYIMMIFGAISGIGISVTINRGIMGIIGGIFWGAVLMFGLTVMVMAVQKHINQ